MHACVSRAFIVLALSVPQLVIRFTLPGGIYLAWTCPKSCFFLGKIEFWQKNVDFTSCLSILGACYAGKIDVFFEKLHFYLHKVKKSLILGEKVSSKGSCARMRWCIVNSDVPATCFIFTS